MPTNPAAASLPPLQLQASKTDQAIVVKCSGHLTFDVSANFKSEVKALIPETRRIVLDLTDLAYMDSSGLGAIISVYVTAKRAGCELRLINFNKRVRELLGITHVLSMFEDFGQFNIRMP
jgi:anti-sigma B factor antagonist